MFNACAHTARNDVRPKGARSVHSRASARRNVHNALPIIRDFTRVRDATTNIILIVGR